MFEFVHARIAWFAAGLLIWTVVGALQDDSEAQAIKKAARVEIGDELVALREPQVGAPRLRDPFQLELPDGAAPVAPSETPAGLGAQVHDLALDARAFAPALLALVAPISPALRAVGSARARLTPLAALPEAPAELGEAPSFRLELQAVSRVDGVGAVRLNGRLFRAGDVIPGLDDLAPPRVQAIEGVSVFVMHRGRVLTLDLDASPSLQVGEALVVEAPRQGAVPHAAPAAASGDRPLTPREKNRLMKQGKLP